MTDTLLLREGAPPGIVPMPGEVAARLAALQIATVVPTESPGEWLVSDVRKVGVTTTAGVQVTIAPKTPVRSILMMMSYSDSRRSWRDEDVEVRDGDELVPAIARSFARLAHRALARGAVRDYHEVERSEMTLRGRWDVTAQITRRLGVIAPLEIVYDEYDGDVPENQIVLTAALRLLAFPALDAGARTLLLQLIHRLDGVTPLPRGGAIPSVRLTRRNARYKAALSLGGVILRGATVQNERGQVSSSGFLVTMSSVFEDFLAAMTSDVAAERGLVVERHTRLPLDRHGRVWIEPDLVVVRGGEPVAIVDAKYKVDHEAVRNPDIYQVVTYARRFGLAHAHLVYVGDETFSRTLEVLGAEVNVHTHALDLSGDANRLVETVARLLERIVRSA